MKSLRKVYIAGCMALAAAAQARDFRSADVHPTDYPTVEAVRYMGKELSADSKGKLSVKVFPNGALGSERDTIEQLKIGALDMMRINAAPLNNIVPETIAISMPFVFRSTEHMRKVLDGPIGDEILAAIARKDPREAMQLLGEHIRTSKEERLKEHDEREREAALGHNILNSYAPDTV